ncbi:unnamed protein product [Aphanomyces euteiches]
MTSTSTQNETSRRAADPGASIQSHKRVVSTPSSSKQTNHHSIIGYPSASKSKPTMNSQSIAGRPRAQTLSPRSHRSSVATSSANHPSRRQSLRKNDRSNATSSESSLHEVSFLSSEQKQSQRVSTIEVVLSSLACRTNKDCYAAEKSSSEDKSKTDSIVAEGPLLSPIPRLDMSWDLDKVKEHTENIQKELKKVVKECKSRDKTSPTAAMYIQRRGELKVAISIAADRLEQLKQDEVPEIEIPELDLSMDRETIKAHIDILKKELRRVSGSIGRTKSDAAKSKLKTQRSALNENIAFAEEQLSHCRDPPQEPTHEMRMLASYIETLKAELKSVVARISETEDMPTLNAMDKRRQKDLKKNLRRARDQLCELVAAKKERQRPSSRKGSVTSLFNDDLNAPSQIYEAVAEKSGYLEWMPQKFKLFRGCKVYWVKLDANGCLLWYKSPSDTKTKGSVDLAQRTSRTVKVAYSHQRIVAITVCTVGILTKSEEVVHFRASSEDEAKAWVSALKDSIDLLAKQFAHQNDDDLFVTRKSA